MRNLARAIVLSTSIMVTANFASAGCLSQYNNYLYICDKYACPNGFFTCAGCYADALAAYWGCVEEQITS